MIEKNLLQYITSGFPIIQINTLEYDRAEIIIEHMFKELNELIISKKLNTTIDGYNLLTWDSLYGIKDFYNNAPKTAHYSVDPINCLAYLRDEVKNPVIAVLKNFDMVLENSLTPKFIDALLWFYKVGEVENKHIIIIGNKKLPEEIRSCCAVIDLPLPDTATIKKLILNFTKSINVKLNEDTLNTVSMICGGMDSKEIINSISMSIIREGKKYNIDTKNLMAEKAKIVKKSGLLEWISVSENIDDIGGLDNLKAWFLKVAKAFKNPEKALKYGLPYMKGTLITGISGTGKSLCAKVIANLFEAPLFRLDIGKLFDSFVGATERNTRELFKLIDAVSPCIIFIDEIEKAISGTDHDSGVTIRLVGSLLYYLQEKKTNSFFVCTANNINVLPPELLRKGRFDELWYVSLPTSEEIKQIINIHIKKINRDVNNFDINKISRNMINFTGAEVETAVKQALYSAFFEDRDITTEDIIKAAKDIIPLAISREEEIKILEQWADSKARKASIKPTVEIEKSSKKFFVTNTSTKLN